MKKKPYIIAFFFFLIDLISKQLIDHLMSVGESIKVINKFFYITYAQNTGAAWSLFEDKRILLLILPIIVLFLINKFMNKEELTKLESISYGMIIGGILGNLFDRLFLGHVIDFIDFKLFGYDYPVFNLADTFIVVGTILIIIISFRKDRNERSKSNKR